MMPRASMGFWSTNRPTLRTPGRRKSAGNSGVEKTPGLKDETLLRAAFAAIKATGAAQTQGVTP